MTGEGTAYSGMPRPRADGLYDISTAADLLGVHPQTLRFYERKGLIDPARSPGGQRRYNDDHLAQLSAIQNLTGEGFNLAAAARILELEAEVQALKQELTSTRQASRRQVAAQSQTTSAEPTKGGRSEDGC